MKSYEIIVFGVVQGVGFRYQTQQIASQIGVTGFVQNLPDGTVKIIVVGTSKQIEELVTILNNFPSDYIQVKDTKVTAIKPNESYPNFFIKY